MFKYGRMQKMVSSWLVRGSHGTCLDCTHVTWGSSHRWVKIFSVFKSFSNVIVKFVTPCFNRLSPLIAAGTPYLVR